MKRKIRIGDLKKLLREALLLREDESNKANDEQESDASLDAQVDRYLAQYEGEAKSSKTEGLDFRMLTRRFLSEAGEDDEGKDDKDDDAAAGEPSKLSLEDIDMDSFANSVVRLIENYDSLLEVRSTLVRRAKNFLGKAYSPDVLDAFENVMRDEHGIVPGESKADVEDEEFQAPRADRAGDGGAGGGGP